jgi:O-glycosyl hydrolase
VACENPDGQKIVVLTNAAAARSVVLLMGASAVDLSLPADSITTLAWK